MHRAYVALKNMIGMRGLRKLICPNCVVLPTLCYNFSIVKCALKRSHQLRSAVNGSEGSFCYKLLFPQMLFAEEQWNTLALGMLQEPFLPVVDLEPALMFLRTRKAKLGMAVFAVGSVFCFRWNSPSVFNACWPHYGAVTTFCIRTPLMLLGWSLQHLH